MQERKTLIMPAVGREQIINPAFEGIWERLPVRDGRDRDPIWM